jgi:hypothetical protein
VHGHHLDGAGAIFDGRRLDLSSCFEVMLEIKEEFVQVLGRYLSLVFLFPLRAGQGREFRELLLPLA